MTEEAQMRSYFVISERVENWKADHRDGFTQFGLPERNRKFANEMKVGDHLITYVASGFASFADVREIASLELVRLRYGGEYDTAFPVALRTRPLLVLNQGAWLPLSDAARQLSLTSNKDTRQIFRSVIRRIPMGDGQLLERAISERVRRTDTQAVGG